MCGRESSGVGPAELPFPKTWARAVPQCVKLRNLELNIELDLLAVQQRRGFRLPLFK